MIIAIVQARMSSKRLPGKVLMPILGEPMLQQQIRRLKHSRKVDRMVVATSDQSSDDVIEFFCKAQGIELFRGSLNNVLDRYYQCAKKYDADHVVRITADCPLIDPSVIDLVIDHYINEKADYASNIEPATFPHGLDCEVLSFKALQYMAENVSDADCLEHVTYWLRKYKHGFNMVNVESSFDSSSYRVTVDYPEDFELVTHLYGALYKEKSNFSFKDIVAYLDENPKLRAINAMHI